MTLLKETDGKNKSITVALAGNPNVGKSTVFNGLTSMKQHTGNWSGKTVTNAVGKFKSDKHSYKLVDIPGAYSLIPHSQEESVAANYLCFSKPDAVIVVCDATRLEQNMNLVLQILEIANRVILCINLMDEAAKKGIMIDVKKIEERLQIPVIAVTAHKKQELKKLVDALDTVFDENRTESKYKAVYSQAIENAAAVISYNVLNINDNSKFAHWAGINLLTANNKRKIELIDNIARSDEEKQQLISSVEVGMAYLKQKGISLIEAEREVAYDSVRRAGEVCKEAVYVKETILTAVDKKIDSIVTSRLFGYPLMLLLLVFIFWLTITASNYPSQLLAKLFSQAELLIKNAFLEIGISSSLISMTVDGILHTTFCVISVMLPPMAIFFPLFTLIEDSGFLPRIAYNLDKPFSKCNACGKQALTMCMGLGCNAVAVTGCRIIDSEREKKLAILTNSLVPCNGRFPGIIALITMFLAIGTAWQKSICCAFILTLIILIGIFTTFTVTFLLSKTIYRGEKSSYILELPSYRKPQFWQVIVRSIIDRIIFTLGRAIAVAAPAGLIIWLLSNLYTKSGNYLNFFAEFLDPAGKLLGFDGAVLLAFILGFPANEIVLPLVAMIYTGGTALNESVGIREMQSIFIANGWTAKTAACVILFSLMHWPCSTTLLTIKKETGSLKTVLAAFFIPTMLGTVACIAVNLIFTIFT